MRMIQFYSMFKMNNNLWQNILILLLISCRLENWKNSGNVPQKIRWSYLLCIAKKISKWLHKNLTEFFSELAEKTRWAWHTSGKICIWKKKEHLSHFHDEICLPIFFVFILWSLSLLLHMAESSLSSLRYVRPLSWLLENFSWK